MKKDKPPSKPVQALVPGKKVTKPKKTASRPTPQIRPSNHAKPTVRFELYAPQAHRVHLAGSFNDWRPGDMELHTAGSGRWTREVLLPPGKHEYLFLVDGQWQPDPLAKEQAPNPYGGHNSLIEVQAK